MADKPFSYKPSQQLRKDLSFGRFDWKTAEDQYKQGKYFDALCSCISYIDMEIGARFIKESTTGVKISHGSVQVNIMISDGQFQVLAPFVDIANARKMIILRKINEINFAALSLARIECRDDTLCFLYSCPLEACEPWKIYDILREICWTADKYDDDFVSMHGASWITVPDITAFSDDRKQQSWQGFKLYLQEAKEWISHWKHLGYNYIAWDVIYITIMKIDQLCAPQGSLKNSIEAGIDKLFEKRDIIDLVSDGIDFLDKLDNMTQAIFNAQLYDVSTFIPIKITGSAANVQATLKQPLTDAYTHLGKNEIISAYLCLQKAAFRLLYNYRFNTMQFQHLELILTSNQNLAFSDAANKLYEALNNFYSNPLDQFVAPAPDKEAEKKSIFSGWFN